MFSLWKEIALTETGILPPLVSDYLQHKQQLTHLTEYPFAFNSFERVIEAKTNHKTDRKLLVEVLQNQYRDIPASQAVTDNVNLLLSDTTFTVVAAHQPCLFMGPLYNIYKISCAINVARQLSVKYPSCHFVPVFWMGSEDHDVEELNHTYVNGKRIEWSSAGTGAVGRWNTNTLQPVIQELKSFAPSSEVTAVLESASVKCSTFGEYTQYFINHIFKEYGLVVLNQDDLMLKKKFSEVIKDEVFHSRATDVLKANVEFLEMSYKVQAKPRDINFFYLGNGFRERIIYHPEESRFVVNNQALLTFSRNEMLAEIEKHPERFSPNVIFRPLYQEMILPNLAFVGGGGELSYWLELKPLFDYHKINFPMLILRNSAVILKSGTQRKIEKLGLAFENCFSEIEQLINTYVKRNMSVELNLKEEKEQLTRIYQSVTAKAEKADSTLQNNAVADLQKALTGLTNLESKMLKAEKRKQEVAIAQLRDVHAALFPENNLQERRENFIPYYSGHLIDKMVEWMDPFSKTFKVIVEKTMAD